MQGSVESLKGAYRSENFLLEMCTPDATAKLMQAFADVCRADGEVLVFSGDEELMHRVLAFVLENKLPLAKVERTEPTLEALFVEVTGK
jgi:hypothetical protein